MPFTHSYSASNVAASTSYNHRGGHILSPTSSSSSIDAASSRHAGSSRSATTVDSPSPSEIDSARSRLFSSGRKSPDPFRRFRRLSSNNSLNVSSPAPMLDARPSLDSQQNQPSPYNDTRIPPYPTSSDRPPSPAPLLDTPRSPPPPLPSPSTKPVFQRPKRTKSSSISILSTGLGLRSKDILHPPSSSSDARRRHRKSASLSGSDVDYSSSTIEPPRAVTPQPWRRPASPSPSLCESLYSVHPDSAAARFAPAPPASAAYTSKQHKQAWYQAQQKTIELENPHNRGAQFHASDTANLFPLNVTTSATATSTPTANHTADRGRGSPADSRSPRPVVETFLSEEEMLAAGIHIIRRRVEEPTATSDSSKTASGFATPQLNEHAAAPAMPPRLYGADHPDFLELIDSPIGSKQPSPLLEQLIDPPASSASMQRAISHSHAKSNSGSLSISSSSSTDYLPYSNNHHDDASSLHNGSTGSLSSGSKHSFSFAKLRRAATKQNNPGGSSRPSTANSSSNEDVTSNRSFLFPPRGQQVMQQQHQQQQQQPQQHHPDSHPASSSGAVPPGYLSPGPGSSASPFLNKHSATVGRASGSLGSTHTAQKGLTQVFNGTGSSAATIGPSSSASRPYHAGVSNGVPPPKPPKPKPSLLATFPRTTNHSLPGSSSAPNTAKLYPSYDSDRHASNARNLLRVPHSAEIGGGNGIYGSIAHSRSQEAVAEARLDAEALRASAGTPLPPPRRLNATRGGYGSTAGASTSGYSSTAMARSTSGGASGVVGALGHVGQFGAAMGRKGWDFMKTFQTSANASSASNSAPAPGRGGSFASGYRSGGVGPAAANEPTRQWLTFLEGPDSGRNTSVAGVFGAPLKDVVLRSRLSSIAADTGSNDDHLGVPDLGKEFSANFLDSPRITPRASLAGTAAGEPLSRDEARHLLLPRIVVRCIESLEKWGPSEEGIYRISGRSSHTAKLRAFFSDPHNDLRLDDVSPADLDINSVCSLLKSYLRELPDTLLPLAQSKALEQRVARLFAETDEVPTEAATGNGGKVTDARAAQISADKVAAELAPLVRQLPVYNWYLLRELADHLGLLAQPDVVARTKMPISNLTLVLAPTVSISLPVLQVLVRHREVVFAGPAPSQDVAATAANALASSPTLAKGPAVRSGPPPKPAKPDKLSSPASRLPVMVRKRASSMGLGALLSSPTSKAAPEKSTKRQHTRTSSTTPSLELPAGIGNESLPSSPSSKFLPASPTSPSIADEPYERPSTSLGHFADSPSRRSSPASSQRRFGSRDAALRFNALALDDHDHDHDHNHDREPGKVGKGEETPIARYYARIREDAERAVEERDGAKTPLAAAAPAASGELRRYWAEKTSSSSSSSSSSTTATLLLSPTLGPGASGRTSALDRPRPPTSSSASFFSGRSRRQDSVNGLAALKPSSAIPQLLRRDAHDEDNGTTKPLKIVKKQQRQHSASASSSSSSSSVPSADGWSDAERTPRLGSREHEQHEQHESSTTTNTTDVTAQIRRYLESGPRSTSGLSG